MTRMAKDLSLVTTIVLAACGRHNMCETPGDDIEDDMPPVVQQPVQNPQQNEQADHRRMLYARIWQRTDFHEFCFCLCVH